MGCRSRRLPRRWGFATDAAHLVARYEAEGLDGLKDRSHRPVRCPHQMPADVEAVLLELRRSRPYWGPRRLVFELARRGIAPVPSESAAYRALIRAAMIDPADRDRRSRKWKRWERGAPMELWRIDIVGGFPLADGTSGQNRPSPPGAPPGCARPHWSRQPAAAVWAAFRAR